VKNPVVVFLLEVFGIAVVSVLINTFLGSVSYRQDPEKWFLSFYLIYGILGGLLAGLLRSIKRNKDESSFKKVEQNLNNIVEKLEDKFGSVITKVETEMLELEKTIKGGKLCFVDFYVKPMGNTGELYVLFDLVSDSDLPIYDVNIQFVDHIKQTAEQADIVLPGEYETHISFPYLPPRETKRRFFYFPLSKDGKTLYHVNVSHRNNRLVKHIFIVDISNSETDEIRYKTFYLVSSPEMPEFKREDGFENISEGELRELLNPYY
jgi:hypothetical protein